MKKHSLFDTLLHLKGNPRACVYTEPLWGIPFNLYIPYMSVYMLALGLNDIQIGIVATVGILSQIIFSLVGGIITDKFGRKLTTFIFDMISWGIPCLIWALSNNFSHFLIAAFINGVFRVTANSWNCLLVEECDKEKIVSIYTWIYIAGLGAAFFAPITGLLLKKYELIPTIRGIFILSFVMMMAKFIILQIYSTETKRGLKRMEETKDISFLHMFKGYKDVIIQIIKTPETLFALSIMIILTIINLVNGNFWAIIVTQHLNISAEWISIFPFIRSIIMMFFYFIVIPKINIRRFKRPLVIGFFLILISQIILITQPEGNLLILIISIIFEACSLSLLQPLVDSMQVVLVDPQERARIIALLYTIVLVITSPFGWIAGVLSSNNRIFPFVMTIGFIIIGLLLVLFVNTNKLSDRPQIENSIE